ncbi:AI-2E family transporter, partial [Paenibacillus sp. 28ISP30-2]|nr:AI-2E family transporter [Paenibacillus sp. 28ISP30-2]
METTPAWKDRFKKFFLNNKFVLFLLVLLLIGLNVLVLTKISYIFTPVIVLLKTIILPVILSGVLYYLFNPLVDMLERNKVKRMYSIIVLYLLILGIITIVITSVVPVIRDQIQGLIQNGPAYSEQVQRQFEKLIGSNFVNQFQNTIQINPSEMASKASEKISAFINN